MSGAGGLSKYTYMRDIVAGKYRLPWEGEMQVTDGTPCGCAPPTRTHEGELELTEVRKYA